MLEERARRASATRSCCRPPASILGGLSAAAGRRGGASRPARRAAGRRAPDGRGSRAPSTPRRTRSSASSEQISQDCRGRAGRGAHRDRRPLDGRREGDHPTCRSRSRDRRQGHPAGAGLAPRRRDGHAVARRGGATYAWFPGSRRFGSSRGMAELADAQAFRSLFSGVGFEPLRHAPLGLVPLRHAARRPTSTSTHGGARPADAGAPDRRRRARRATSRRWRRPAPGAALRPHVKAHKCTSLAAAQLDARPPHVHVRHAARGGRHGRAGLGDDLLVANETLDPARLRGDGGRARTRRT